VKFQYNAQHDTGSYKRLKSFHIDPNVPSSCQQLSAKTYKQKGQRYDRGHLVPANHLDYSKVAIRQSNFMTNILPQAANMNRGAWLLTEEITECYRDIDELLVIGGVLWGDNLNDDFFTESHGVKTPDASWKVIIRNDRAIAWIIPNIADAKRNRLDEYIVTIQELELVTGESIPVDEYLKHEKPEYSWVIPRGCNKG
jgi:endonuclease G